MDEELEGARKRKLAEMKKRQEDAEGEEKLRGALRAVLEDPAYERMMNVRVANRELYVAAVQGCVSVFNRVRRKLNEKEVLLILHKVRGEENETKITFERK